jgi:hypothetical protein
VPPAGIPLERLWLRSLRSVDRLGEHDLIPIRLALSVPGRLAAGTTAPRDLHDRWLWPSSVLRGPPAAHPSLLWEGNLVPGRSVAPSPVWLRPSRSAMHRRPPSCQGRRSLTGTRCGSFDGLARDTSRLRLDLAGDRPLCCWPSAARRPSGASTTPSLPHCPIWLWADGRPARDR